MRSLLIVARDGSGGQWDPVARLMCLVGCAARLPKDVGEPECAFAEPVAQHRDVTVAEVDDAAFGRDEPGPGQMDPVVLAGDRSPVRHEVTPNRASRRPLVGHRQQRSDLVKVLVDARQLPTRIQWCDHLDPR